MVAGVSVAPTASDEVNFPEWDAAIQAKSVTFEDLCRAAFDATSSDEDARRQSAAGYFPRLLQAFRDQAGSLLETYYCSDVVAGCALTSRSSKDGPRYTLHTVSGLASATTAPVAALIPRCERMCVDATELLKEPERGTQAKQLFSVATYLIGLMNDLAVPGRLRAADAQATLRIQSEELARVDRDFRRYAQRDAQITYFGGMLLGLLGATVTAVLTGWVLSRTAVSLHARDDVIGAFCAGSVGAFVSVMARMSSDRLTLRFRTGRFYLRLLGAFRPLIGALLAVALYFLIVAGILNVFKVPGDHRLQFYFFCGVGFLAGFSERWAQDMLVVPQTASRTAVEETRVAMASGA